MLFRYWKQEDFKYIYQDDDYLISFLQSITNSYGVGHPDRLPFKIEENMEVGFIINKQKVFAGDVIEFYRGDLKVRNTVVFEDGCLSARDGVAMRAHTEFKVIGNTHEGLTKETI